MNNLFFAVLDRMVSIHGYVSAYKVRKVMRTRLNLLIDKL